MTLRARLVLLVVSALTCGGLITTVGVSPASATVTTLCTGYSACSKAGMNASGYAAVRGTMFWRMFAGHNCTNYAAYRMVRSGLPNVRPWTGNGNATYWGTKMSAITNDMPAVGSVAWWKAGVSPAGSAGHVAYVEQVISADEIIVSQDSWGGDFSWARITSTTRGWPSGFIHFNDVPLLNTRMPVITGTARVGSALTASTGSWKPSGVTLRYRWRANGVRIVGATASTLSLTLAQQAETITVRVTASRLGYPTTSVVSAATAAVQPGVISNTVAPAITGDAIVDSTLTASPGRWNPAPDSLSYQWLADGAPLDGAGAPTLRIDPSLVGKALSVSVTASKSGYDPVTVTSKPTGAVLPGTLTLGAVPTVTGVTRPGRRLTLTPAGVSPKAVASVQWLRAGVPVPGATGMTYRLSTADLGARIRARVVLTRPGYTTLTVRTELTARVRATPRLKVSLQAGRSGRLAVTATMTASGVHPVTGVVRVRSRGHVIGRLRLRNGTAKTTLSGLPPGVWTFRVVFPTTPTVSRARVARRVTIR
ncbi:MAG: CHAP domain-containing protein [Nocardioidaceae bacterium]